MMNLTTFSLQSGWQEKRWVHYLQHVTYWLHITTAVLDGWIGCCDYTTFCLLQSSQQTPRWEVCSFLLHQGKNHTHYAPNTGISMLLCYTGRRYPPGSIRKTKGVGKGTKIWEKDINCCIGVLHGVFLVLFSIIVLWFGSRTIMLYNIAVLAVNFLFLWTCIHGNNATRN